MPTTLPPRPSRPTYRRGRPLTQAQAVQFYWLFACAVTLDVRLQRAHARLDRLGLDAGGDELLRLAHRWLACHEAIRALLGTEEPAAVTQVRRAIRAHGITPGPGR